MSNSELPERASLEYLKKLAKDRLLELRRSDPHTKLATALLAVARDHGFSSWRALKAEVERRQAGNSVRFFDACAQGDVAQLRVLLADDPNLVRARRADRATGLHPASQHGHLDVVRILLEYGADPNAREAGDNTYPLHWAAAHGHAGVVRALLDAGGDAQGLGDVHELDAIGWATCFQTEGGNPEVVSLLIERGARHHIFSAIHMGDLPLIQQLVEQNPEALDRRMSRFEKGQTALHLAIDRKRYDILDLLIELGADVEGEDLNGQTAMEMAMLRGDREAMSRLQAAGARVPESPAPSNFRTVMAELAGSVGKGVPMISVPDVARTLAWYTSIGFREIGRYGEGGVLNWGMVAFGKAELMFVTQIFQGTAGKSGLHDASLWFYTSQVNGLYESLKARQLGAAQAALAGLPGDGYVIEFVEDIYDAPYRAREFGIRDPDGYVLYFIQPLEA